ncbi:hypothetical protein ALC56_01126, partial [Trachymyrmex septentrionalis]
LVQPIPCPSTTTCLSNAILHLCCLSRRPRAPRNAREQEVGVLINHVVISVLPLASSCVMHVGMKTRFPDELKDDPSAVCDFRADTSDWRNRLILVRKLEVLRKARWSNMEDQHEIRE